MLSLSQKKKKEGDATVIKQYKYTYSCKKTQVSKYGLWFYCMP